MTKEALLRPFDDHGPFEALAAFFETATPNIRAALKPVMTISDDFQDLAAAVGTQNAGDDVAYLTPNASDVGLIVVDVVAAKTLAQ